MLFRIISLTVGLFILNELKAAQPASDKATPCSAAIHNMKNELRSANKKNLTAFFDALSHAKDDETLEFIFSRNIQVICPFKNLCGVGSSSAKVELCDWLQIMSQNQVGQQLEIQILPDSFKVILKKDSKNPLNIPNLVEVGDETFVPAPLSTLYFELKDDSPTPPDDN